MSVLDRIGLAPKPGRRPRRTGFKLESRAANRQRLSAHELIERVALFVGLIALSLLAFPRLVVYEDTPQVGDVWRSDDVVAPFNFPIRLSDAELMRRRDSVRVQEPPVFVGVPDALARTEGRLDSLARGLDSTFAAYGAWQEALARGRDARPDSARYALRRAATRLSLSDDQWKALLASYAARAGTLPAPTRPESGPALDDRLLDAVRSAARPLLARQVLNIPLDSVRAEQLVVRSTNPRDRDEQLVQKVEVLGLDGAYTQARRSLAERFTDDTLGVGQ
jgi:cyclic-di-AMP phosphodiesterase PgpH